MESKLSIQVKKPSPTWKTRKNFLLKACIFATGLSGIVAEYIMSTLASYLLGNTVLQWTLTVSFMLFAMGLGSRLSRFIPDPYLLDAFVITEFMLSILTASSATLTYLLSAYVQDIWLFIYAIAVTIGILIGFEIPLATRLNDFFEELRINISTVMEKDYYGALLGGLLFAFVALPHLGLSYTPIILGSVNFLVATALFVQFRQHLVRRKSLTAGLVLVPVFIALTAVLAQPIVLYGEQRKYMDKIIYSEQTPYQRIVMTQWKAYFWLYLDGNEQFSTYDEERYHEPLVHPAMQTTVSHRRVLILGGGDGLALREVLKYPDVESVTLVDIDPAVTRLAATHPILVSINQNALNHPKVRVINRDAYAYLRDSNRLYDVIIIDLPDPKTVQLARLYSVEFYRLCRRQLARGGTLVTQATSPFFAQKAFLSILKTVRAAGFTAVPYRNHIPTLGEWGWVLGINRTDLPEEAFRKQLQRLDFSNVPTRFLNREAMTRMLLFGKNELQGLDTVEVTNQVGLKVYQYYLKGDWDLY